MESTETIEHMLKLSAVRTVNLSTDREERSELAGGSRGDGAERADARRTVPGMPTLGFGGCQKLTKIIFANEGVQISLGAGALPFF